MNRVPRAIAYAVRLQRRRNVYSRRCCPLDCLLWSLECVCRGPAYWQRALCARVVGVLVPIYVVLWIGVYLYISGVGHDLLGKFTPTAMPKDVTYPRNERYPFNFYTVLFHMGRTTTDVYVCQFYMDTGDNFRFQSVSSPKPINVDLLTDGGSVAGRLLTEASRLIPRAQWQYTPLIVRINEDVRNGLGSTGADMTLKIISDMLTDARRFLICDNCVSFLTSVDKGISVWMTINLMVDALTGHDLTRGVVTLDLSANSNWLTFPLHQSTPIGAFSDSHIRRFEVLGVPQRFYSDGYTNYSLNGAWVQIALLHHNATLDNRNGTVLHLPCFSEDFQQVLQFKNNTYTFRGTAARNSVKTNFHSCYTLAQQLVTAKLNTLGANFIQKVPELMTRAIYATSSYYETAKCVKLTDTAYSGLASWTPVPVTVGDYCHTAETICEHSRVYQVSTAESELRECLDLIYICALLQDGLKLPKEKSIFLHPRTQRSDDWTIGNSFDVLYKSNFCLINECL